MHLRATKQSFQNIDCFVVPQGYPDDGTPRNDTL